MRVKTTFGSCHSKLPVIVRMSLISYCFSSVVTLQIQEATSSVKNLERGQNASEEKMKTSMNFVKGRLSQLDLSGKELRNKLDGIVADQGKEWKRSVTHQTLLETSLKRVMHEQG